MSHRVGIEPRILDYFKTAPLSEARLLFGLVSAEVKSRVTLMELPPAKKLAKKSAQKGSRVSKQPAAARPNGVEQRGEAVAIENVLG